jgi:hypothetical protein
MPRDCMMYWRPETADAGIAHGWLLNRAASNQLRRVKPGDTVWIVAVHPPGQLWLLGRIIVGIVTDYEGAKKQVGN